MSSSAEMRRPYHLPKSAVAKGGEASFSQRGRVGTVVGSPASPGRRFASSGMCRGYLPLRSDARAGPQMGAELWNWVKRTPSSAMRRRWGVRISEVGGA